jgi:hypothetical protein
MGLVFRHGTKNLFSLQRRERLVIIIRIQFPLDVIEHLA